MAEEASKDSPPVSKEEEEGQKEAEASPAAAEKSEEAGASPGAEEKEGEGKAGAKEGEEGAASPSATPLGAESPSPAAKSAPEAEKEAEEKEAEEKEGEEKEGEKEGENLKAPAEEPAEAAAPAAEAAPEEAAPPAEAEATLKAAEEPSPNGPPAGVAAAAPVDVVTGEEREEVVWEERGRLFRFDKVTGGWKERGTGEAKLMKDKENQKVRFLMRKDATKQICANHRVNPKVVLKPSAGSNRSYVWVAVEDLADDEATDDTLALRFKTPEMAETFKEAFEKAAFENGE